MKATKTELKKDLTNLLFRGNDLVMSIQNYYWKNLRLGPSDHMTAAINNWKYAIKKYYNPLDLTKKEN